MLAIRTVRFSTSKPHVPIHTPCRVTALRHHTAARSVSSNVSRILIARCTETRTQSAHSKRLQVGLGFPLVFVQMPVWITTVQDVSRISVVKITTVKLMVTLQPDVGMEFVLALLSQELSARYIPILALLLTPLQRRNPQAIDALLMKIADMVETIWRYVSLHLLHANAVLERSFPRLASSVLL